MKQNITLKQHMYLLVFFLTGTYNRIENIRGDFFDYNMTKILCIKCIKCLLYNKKKKKQ